MPNTKFGQGLLMYLKCARKLVILTRSVIKKLNSFVGDKHFLQDLYLL